MPIVIPKNLPAYKILTDENIFVMAKLRASRQDIRPIEIAILNLMPTKIDTENQLLRLLSNSPLQINLTLVQTKSYQATHVSIDHMQTFYKTFDQIKDLKFDGMIITGAPVENMPFEEVKYWRELTEIFDYCEQNVTSTVFICWASQAAAYHYYGIRKHMLDKKLFGVFSNYAVEKNEILLKGMNDIFYMPQSRHTAIDEKAIYDNEKLAVLSRSDESGISIFKSKDNSKIFITGHAEYDRFTLRDEYLRDVGKNLPIDKPKNYFIGDDLDKVDMSWLSTANLLFYNWLNYYIYQETPYNRDDINKNRRTL